jgi:surface antigen Omp85-like protein/surface antigen-like variable number repeat protein
LKRFLAPVLTSLLVGSLGGGAALAQEPSPAPSPAATPLPARQVSAIVLNGVTRFDKETVWKTLGVKPGGTLRREPGGLARLLEEHYRTLGYAAVKVEARFDEATGTLRLDVDEGKLKAVEVEGVRGSERERVLSMVDLKPGDAFNDEAVADTLRRLESDTSGAFEAVGDPPYTLQREEDGVRLTLTLHHRAARIGIGPGGVGVAALYNRVDGFAPGVSARALIFTPSAFNPIELYGDANYAFSAERVRYAVGALKRFGTRGPLVLGYEHHDFTDNDHVYRAAGVEQLRGWHFFFTTFQDYYRRRGDEAYAFVRPAGNLHLGVNFRSDTFESQPIVSDHFLFFRQDPPPNPAVADGLSRSFLFTSRWSWKEPLFDDWGAERHSFLVRDPYGTPFQRPQVLRAEGTLEVADAEALGGVFTFKRFTGHVRGAARLSLRHTLLGRVTVGMGSEGLPPQRRFSLGGNGTLRGRDRDDVTGDHMLLTSAEWQIEPNAPWPAVVFFYDGGTAWDAGVPRPSWRHDAGLGLAWPPGDTRFIRVDVALPLNTLGGERTVRVTGFVRVPF